MCGLAAALLHLLRNLLLTRYGTRYSANDDVFAYVTKNGLSYPPVVSRAFVRKFEAVQRKTTMSKSNRPCMYDWRLRCDCESSAAADSCASTVYARVSTITVGSPRRHSSW